MKALIIDDEPNVIAVARLLVDWEKYHIDEVLSSVDSIEALSLIKKERPAIIISDIRMPGLDGLSLIEQVQQIDAAARTILISAFSDFAYAKKALSLGCVDYLLKPLTEEGLNNAVEKAVTLYDSMRALLTSSECSQAKLLADRFLNNEQKKSILKELEQNAVFFKNSSNYRLGIVRTNAIKEMSIDLNHFSLDLHEALYQEDLGCSAFPNANGDILLLLTASAKREVLDRIFATLEEKWQISQLMCGLSEPHEFPADWNRAYIEANHMAPIGKEDTLEEIRQYIENQYAMSLSLEMLANVFALSPSYLSRSFKKRYNIGLVDYITNVRIEKARLLLSNSPLRISEIAIRVGIPDPKYFSRIFKRLCGTTPADYRGKGTVSGTTPANYREKGSVSGTTPADHEKGSVSDAAPADYSGKGTSAK